MILRRACLTVCAMAACLLLPAALHGQGDYPNRPIRIIFGFPPGTDGFVRLVADKLAEALGKPVVIENVIGAAGNIAADRVAKAAPDGYTIGAMTTASIAINGSLYARLPYDPTKDFLPLTQITITPTVLVVSRDVPAKSVQELIALARARPGELSFGHAGPGTTLHLAGELLKLKTGIEIQQVPYRGPGPITQDLLGGRIAMAFQVTGGILPFIAAGKVRALAVTTRERIPHLPDVPTMAEAGFPDFDMTVWTGLFLPAGTPQPILDRLSREVARIMALPDIRNAIEIQGSAPAFNTQEEFAGIIKADTAYWAKLIRDVGIPPLQ
jgi:tripartite-type tricarboxylate transporter receptor subunit TctC